SVERRRGGALEDRDALDVLGVQILDRVAVVDTAVAACLGAAGEVRVVDRDAIHDPDGLVVAADRVLAADDDTRRATEVGGAGDLHAGDLPRERVDDVGRLRLVEVRALDTLCRDAERPLLTLE